MRDALRAGAERAIVGTAAFRDVDFLDEILGTFGPRIIVSVDVRGGYISTAGWTQTTELPAAEAIRRLQDRGVASFVYTNADRDGTLEGPDSTRSSAMRRGRPRALPVLRRHRPPRGSRRWPACARSTSPA